MKGNSTKPTKLFNSFLLKYVNNNVEEHYQQYIQLILYNQFLSVGIFLSLIYFLYFLSNTFWFKDQKNGYIRLAQSITMAVSIPISRKYKRIITLNLIAQEVAHVILNTELFFINRIQNSMVVTVENKMEIYSLGISLTIYIFSICHITKQWYQKFFQTALINYPILRLTSQFNLSIFIIQLFLLYFGVVFYLQERSERNHYYNFYEQGKNINEFKFFLNQLMPTPCFVVSREKAKRISTVGGAGGEGSVKGGTGQGSGVDGRSGGNSCCNYPDQMKYREHNNNNKLKVAFYNHKCLVEFNIADENVIIQKCQYFFNTINDSSDQCIKQAINTRKILIEILEQEIENVIEKISRNGRKNKSLIQPSYELFEEKTLLQYQYNEEALSGEQVDNICENEMYYDIKIMQCLWDSEPALMVMLHNVSQKIINNRLKATDQYKDQLLASVTHDLKNPLNGIITMLQSSQHIEEAHQLKQINCIILKNAQLFSSLINDILDYSQIIKGKLRLVPSRFSLKTLINEVFQLFQFTVQQKGIKLQLDQSICSGSDSSKSKFSKTNQIYSDENRLKQILINLIGNAIKFTYHGSITVVVEECKEFQNCVSICVKDTGVGIPQNIQDKLFQAFATFDDKKGSNKFGIGLGLHICRKIVKELGPLDRITLFSTINVGSSFSFVIYRNVERDTISKEKQQFQSDDRLDEGEDDDYGEDLNGDEIIEEKEKKDSFEKNIRKVIQRSNIKSNTNIFYQKQISTNQDYCQNQLIRHNSQRSIDAPSPRSEAQYFNALFKVPTRILVVDDDQFNLYGFCCLMKPFDNLVIEKAFNGQEAIEKVLFAQKMKNQFKIILTDINMPVMDGFEEIIKIRQYISDKLVDDIILITITSDVEDQRKSLLIGANYTLNKPIIYSEVISIFQQLLN